MSGADAASVGHGGKRKHDEVAPVWHTFAVSTSVGPRPTQEDRYIAVPNAWVEEAAATWPACGFFGVFDGHRGHEAAEFVSRQLWVELRRRLVALLHADSATSAMPAPDALEDAMLGAFAATDAAVMETAGESGSTATVVLLMGDGLCIANLGDSKTVLCRSERCFWQTEDHKPERPAERMRIVGAGGHVCTPHAAGEHNVPRLNGVLSVSRAFGDADFKRVAHDGAKAVDPQAGGGSGLSAEPDVTHRRLGDGRFGFRFDEFLLLASDGLWDVMSGDTAVEIARAELRKAKSQSRDVEGALQQQVQSACDKLVSRAVQSGHCMDNVTVVLVMLSDTDDM